MISSSIYSDYVHSLLQGLPDLLLLQIIPPGEYRNSLVSKQGSSRPMKYTDDSTCNQQPEYLIHLPLIGKNLPSASRSIFTSNRVGPYMMDRQGRIIKIRDLHTDPGNVRIRRVQAKMLGLYKTASARVHAGNEDEVAGQR